MSLECLIGPEGNLLSTDENNVKRLRLEHPILSNQELEKIRSIKTKGYKSKTIDITYQKGSRKRRTYKSFGQNL